ncbi:hypothetical protein Dred_0582 [Desulforamulus reducens MI-1]|uniref:DUF4194 domain-containing protein n=1 Tax=Desulforamulus reducens (strain ATCC BAA-1160 / DSM 100696 / MI-1) TaxID=349161 RepID=A4J221_DESRM|nr:DUF4194 domain-containing protein [Desulforamulus reducens]ABO49124.1 hypothetical protein Dred_0582 [Desulforamulus reducens MI-1]
MWAEAWEKLTDRDKEEFVRVINLLLSKTFILRDEYEPKTKSLVINKDFRFVERHHSLIQEYLGIAGWYVQNDAYRGVIAAYNRFGTNRYRLDKPSTYFLYTLRLIYEESREKIALAKQCTTTVGEMVEKMFYLGLVEKKPPDTHLREGLNTLKRFNIIEKVEGDWAKADTRIVVYPSIELIVSNEKISNLYDQLTEEGEDDETTDQDIIN